MRLKVVDYDAVRVAFDEKFKETWRLIQEGETHLDNLAEGFHEADGVIWTMPTIEAEPVKHGDWMWDEENEGYYCPHCPTTFWKSSDVPDAFKRCPLCGAKMDGE